VDKAEHKQACLAKEKSSMVPTPALSILGSTEFHTPALTLSKLVHKSTNTGLGSTTSAPRGGDIAHFSFSVNASQHTTHTTTAECRAEEPFVYLSYHTTHTTFFF